MFEKTKKLMRLDRQHLKSKGVQKPLQNAYHRRKRMLAVTLTVSMVLSMLPINAFTEVVRAQDNTNKQRAATLDLTAAEVQYTGADDSVHSGNPATEDITSGEGWSWDHTLKTLTLFGADISGGDTADQPSYGIKLPDGAIVMLADGTTNTVQGGKSNKYNPFTTTNSFGIYSSGTLTIKGTGVLQSNGGTAGDESGGIMAEDTLLLDSGTIIAGGGTSQNYASYGIGAAGTISVSGSAITATGGTSDNKSFGIYAISGSVAINGGTVTATGGASSGKFRGSYGISAYSDITISGGTGTAAGGDCDFSLAFDKQPLLGSEMALSDAYNSKTVNWPATPVSADCTITWDDQGATTAHSGGSTTLAQGEAITLPTTQPRKNGYTFGGWYTETNGSGTEITNSSTAPAQKAVTYYAKWTADSTAIPRTTTLNLSGQSVSYKDTNGATKTVDPATTDITDSGEGWSWICSTKTLTLSGANISGEDSTTEGTYGILISDGTTITLADGTVNAVRGGAASGNDQSSYGIKVMMGAVEINGTGTLEATGGRAGFRSYGIYAGNSINITSGTITATGGEASGSYGMKAPGYVSISGSVIHATGGEADKVSVGIYTDWQGTVNITGGTVTAIGGISATGDSYGIYSYYQGTVNITGGTVTATGGTAKAGNSYGVSADKVITITRGSGTAAGTTSAFNKDLSKDSVMLTGNWNDKMVGWDTGDDTCSITWDDQGADTVHSGGSGIITQGAAITIPTTSPKKNGYAFGGYWTTADGTGTQITRISTAPKGVGVTYYARWTPVTVTSIQPRITELNFLSGTLSYVDTNGVTKTVDPTTTNITDSAEGWTWYKTAADGYGVNTLILSGANIKNNTAQRGYFIGINLLSDTTVVLAEGTTSTVQAEDISDKLLGGIGILSGYMAPKATLTIEGTGTLEVRGGSYGISGEYINIKSGTINACAGTVIGDVIDFSCGINVGSKLNMTGGTVNATGGTMKRGYSCGIKFDDAGDDRVNFISNATVNATGGTVETGNSSGIYTSYYSGAILIYGDKVTATGGNVTVEGESYGICTNISMVWIYGGTGTAACGTATSGGAFKYDPALESDMTLSDVYSANTVSWGQTPTSPVITTNFLPDGMVGTAYSQRLVVSGTTPIIWDIADGTLPAGLTFNTVTGTITGTPTAAGKSIFTVKAKNSVGETIKVLSITVTSPIKAISISPSSATVKKTKTKQFTADVEGEGDKTVTWSVSGGTNSSISADGLLTVGGRETADTLTVKAASVADSSVFATAVVTVATAPKNFTVTFDSDGGSAVAAVGNVEEGSTIKLPDLPTKENCRFDGWYTAKNGGGTPFTAFTPVTGSITVYAKWTKLITLSGTVVEETDGTPISDASVTISPDHSTSAVTTGADGTFRFADIPEGLFTVTAAFTDGSSVTVNVTGNYDNVKIIKPKPYITITGQPQDGYIIKGIAGQSAVYRVESKRTPNIPDSIACEWWWLKGDTPSGAAPDVKIEGSGNQMTFNTSNGNIPDRGTYKLYALAYTNDGVPLVAYSRVATLKVVGINTIAGVVSDAKGDPVNGASVKLEYVGTWPYGSVAMTSSTNPQTTTADGEYTFETVPDGRYRLIITLPEGGSITYGPYDFPGSNPDPDKPIDPGIVLPDKASIQVNAQPQDATVKNGTSVTLKASAASTDGTVLHYQWYKNTKNSSVGGTEVAGATDASYIPSTTDKGTLYYYCVVSGGTLDNVTTRVAKVTVYTYGSIAGTVQTKEKLPIEGATVELINIDTPKQTGITASTNPQTTLADGKYKFAEVPDGTYKLRITLPGTDGPVFEYQPVSVPNVIPDLPLTSPDKAVISITSQPKSLTVALNDTAKFSVAAGVSTGDNVLYQWYSNTTNSTADGTAIPGATGCSYLAPTTVKGVTYYYCVIRANDADALTSGIARLTVRNTPLDNLMTIEGNVVDENGDKVENAQVSLSPKAGTSENPQTTQTDGHYKFENLPDGKYTLTVKLPGGGEMKQEIILDDGEITPSSPNDIEVPANNSITITGQPKSIEVTTDMTASFMVKAAAIKTAVTYQWYESATGTNNGGTKLEGQNSATLDLDKQSEGVSYYYCVISAAGAEDVSTDAAKLTVKKAKAGKGDLNGGIVSDEDGSPVEGATIKLMKNGTDGTQFGSAVTTGADGKFNFTDIPYGSYSLVAQKDSSTVTRQITMKSASATENLIMPGGAKITKVVINGNTPSAAVDNLEGMFTDADTALAQLPGATVEIKLVLEQQDSPSDKDNINTALTQNQQVGLYLNAKLVKTIDGTIAEDGTENIQPQAGQVLRIVLDLPAALQGKTGYQIIRSHTENGLTSVRAITPDYDSDLQTLSFDADVFSTYAVVYNQTQKYSVTVLGSQAGNSSGSGLYEEGEAVTIQAGTKEGYTFDGWSSADGVSFANAGSATTSFTMPAGNVTVTAAWKSNAGSNNTPGSSNDTPGSSNNTSGSSNNTSDNNNTSGDDSNNPGGKEETKEVTIPKKVTVTAGTLTKVSVENLAKGATIAYHVCTPTYISADADGNIFAKKAGKAVLMATVTNKGKAKVYTIKVTVKPAAKPTKVGYIQYYDQIIRYKNINYRITKNASKGTNGTVAVANNQVNDKLPAKVSIPAFITLNQKKYKVVSIDESAFYSVKGIVSVSIPYTVTDISSTAFTGCSKLTLFKVNKKNSAYTARKAMLLDKSGTTLISYPSAKKKVTVDRKIKIIGAYAFSVCHGLKEVIIPGNVKEIDGCAFAHSGLVKVTFKSSKVPVMPYPCVFELISKQGTIYVPKKAATSYTKALKVFRMPAGVTVKAIK